jgi:hypothetical protein
MFYINYFSTQQLVILLNPNYAPLHEVYSSSRMTKKDCHPERSEGSDERDPKTRFFGRCAPSERQLSICRAEHNEVTLKGDQLLFNNPALIEPQITFPAIRKKAIFDLKS